MATDCAEQNVSTLKMCLDQISHIFEDERKNFKAKILKLEEEKGVLYGLLQSRNDLEKENTDIKTENKVLKEEISFLRLSSNECQAKLTELESKFEQYRKTITKKQTDWARFAHIVRKKCTCKFNDSLKKSSDSLISSPSLKIKNVSNVFFMSPVKSRSSGNGTATLAPMTEEYNGDLQHFKASTPLVVGETERSPCLHYEINSSDNESDDERVCSPSLFTDHESKVETPAPSNKSKRERHMKTVSIDLCKPSPMDRLTLSSPMDRLTLGEQKHERIETSALLFSDKSNNEDNGHKGSDVSSESNIDFHRSSVHVYKEKVKSSRTVKKEEGAEENEDNSCFKKPLKPVLKKRKYVEEEVDELEHHNNCSNSKNTSTNQTWARGDNVINPRNNTSNPMVRKKEMDKSEKNVSASVDNNRNNKVSYKHSTVVRKKHEREKLDGFACDECRRYYESDKLSKEQMAEVLKHCSRHKHVSAPPPSTPEQFWTLDFPQTQDCIDKGYMLDENQTIPDHAKPKWKRTKKKKTVNFKK